MSLDRFRFGPSKPRQEADSLGSASRSTSALGVAARKLGKTAFSEVMEGRLSGRAAIRSDCLIEGDLVDHARVTYLDSPHRGSVQGQAV